MRGSSLVLLIFILSGVALSCAKVRYFSYEDVEYQPVEELVVIDNPEELPKGCQLFGRLEAKSVSFLVSHGTLRKILIKEAKQRGADVISFDDLRKLKQWDTRYYTKTTGLFHTTYRDNTKLLLAYLFKCDTTRVLQKSEEKQ